MRKYSIWYDNGTGYYDCACTVQADSKQSAIQTARDTFALTGELVATVGVENPNKPYPDPHRTERSRKFRERQTKTATRFGFTGYANAGSAFVDALSQPSTPVHLATPLACGVVDCENDAYAAHAYPVRSDLSPGLLWILQPICQECTRKLAELYEKGDD